VCIANVGREIHGVEKERETADERYDWKEEIGMYHPVNLLIQRWLVSCRSELLQRIYSIADMYKLLVRSASDSIARNDVNS
jgi:hypothetical protein